MSKQEIEYTSQKIRETFLQYFADRSHTKVASSPLVPAGDKTLLFTNAGMVQFKDVFVGKEKRNYVRATSCQKCVRAGGKHNDLENVGRTKRHHTFFEMLGNFSFGDYFKQEAIHYAWEFLTEVVKLDPSKLWVTVHDDDDEAEGLWRAEWEKSGKKGQGISRCGADNFWAMGDTGPCGPCSEIFYDHGGEFAGDPPGGEDEGERYVEIWNLVFMQFERDEAGNLNPLPKPSVDTGMGLERVAAVLQGVHDNYDTDVLKSLLEEEAKLWDITAKAALEHQVSLRVIADHIRATSFLIADGVVPSNEGRGYVLRRIMRRALRHLKKLPAPKNASLVDLLPCLDKLMGEAYGDLRKKVAQIKTIVQHEEKSFAITLEQGLKIFNDAFSQIKGEKVVPGELVFLLYDTYGFPPDLTEDLAREHGFSIDQKGFDSEMQKQRDRAKQSGKFKEGEGEILSLENMLATTFTGYDTFIGEGKVTALFQNGEPVDSLEAEAFGIVVLDKTPFYAESGGQVGDQGELLFKGGVFVVSDTQKQNDVFLHYGQIKEGVLREGSKIKAQVSDKRLATMLNHSATHLLHKALQMVLGEHVVQKGSLVDPKRLRFDFAHFKALSAEEIREIETIVNEQIRANLKVMTEVKTFKEAKQSGAMALFDEKYGDKVRIVTMGEGESEFSKEFCGGTHVANTGQIGFLKIVSETAIASGIRRIEALTGANAFRWAQELDARVNNMARLMQTGSDDVANKLQQLLDDKTKQQREMMNLKKALAKLQLNNLLGDAKEVNGVKVLLAKLEHVDMAVLRESAEVVKESFKEDGVVLLAAVVKGKVQVCCGVTKNLSKNLKAGDLVKYISGLLQGSGGGKPELAQGGGTDVAALDEALKATLTWIKKNSPNENRI